MADTARADIQYRARAGVVTYRPIFQFGGWGIRAGRFDGEKTSVYTVRGDDGVFSSSSPRSNGSRGFAAKRFLIGSLEPARLSAAIGNP